MCRLLGIYGQTDLWREIALEFSKQAENGDLPPEQGLEPGHKDGWGMAASSRNKKAMFAVTRQLGSAYNSSSYLEAIDSLADRPDILLCHLRKASDNIPITLSNTHPFFHEYWALTHNGTIYQPESLPRNPTLKLTSNGSDTELFFHYLLTKIMEAAINPKISQIIADAVTCINTDYTALNSMLSNGKELYVISRYQQWDEYYTLHFYEHPDCVIISSQIIESRHLNPLNWNKLPNNSLLRVHRSPPEIEKIQIKKPAGRI